MENGALAIFPNTFTISSSYKQKFFLCPFVYEETNRSYPFTNGLNGLNNLPIYAIFWQYFSENGGVILIFFKVINLTYILGSNVTFFRWVHGEDFFYLPKKIKLGKF
jgi:hypothetical protein